MKISIETENYELNSLNLERTFNLLKNDNDELLINTPSQGTALLIKVKKESKIRISSFIKNVYVNENEVENQLTSLIITFLNYKEVTLRGITVRNSLGVKSKPIIKLYCKNMPYLQIEDELFYDKINTKKITDSKECFTFVNQPFVSDNEIIHSLLKTNVLAFNNINKYKVCKTNSKLFIYRTNEINSIYENIFYIEPLRDFYIFILENRMISETIKNICDVFLNEFDSELDESFYNALIEFETKGSKLEDVFLKNLIKMAPKFPEGSDFLNYFDKIIEIFDSKGYNKRKKLIKSNNLIEEESIERFYGGSFKNYLNK